MKTAEFVERTDRIFENAADGIANLPQRVMASTRLEQINRGLPFFSPPKLSAGEAKPTVGHPILGHIQARLEQLAQTSDPTAQIILHIGISLMRALGQRHSVCEELPSETITYVERTFLSIADALKSKELGIGRVPEAIRATVTAKVKERVEKIMGPMRSLFSEAKQSVASQELSA